MILFSFFFNFFFQDNGLELIPQEEAIKRCSLKEHELELECSLKLPGAASAETVIQALRLLVKQYLPDSISDWSQERFLIYLNLFLNFFLYSRASI